MAKIAGLILAAGLSTRMGQFKLLLAWKDDKPLIWHLVEQVKPFPLEPLILVTGHRAEDIHKFFETDSIQLVHNPNYAEGELLSSLQTGLRALPADVDAILVILGDMPLIKAASIQKIIEAYQANKIIVPYYQQKAGHPVLFTKPFFEKILRAKSQPREVIQSNPDSVIRLELDDVGILIDIDTPEDYEKFQKT